MGRSELAREASRFRWTTRGYIDAFIDALDRIARDEDATLWLEKTPSHLARIDLIERHVDNARFIHIVRRGVDVVASLYKVTRDYPEAWGGSRTVETCIDRWIADLRRTERYMEQPNHRVVRYEELLERPEGQLEGLCESLELSFAPSMLEDYRAASRQVVATGEAWKGRNDGPLKAPTTSKFEELFDAERRERIIDRLEQAAGPWPVRR